MFREFGFAFCISEVFPMFFKSWVEVSVGSSYIKFVAVGACQFYLKVLMLGNWLKEKLVCSFNLQADMVTGDGGDFMYDPEIPGKGGGGI